MVGVVAVVVVVVVERDDGIWGLQLVGGKLELFVRLFTVWGVTGSLVTHRYQVAA